MLSFKDWITEDKYEQFIHKFRKGDQSKYSKRLSYTLTDVLGVNNFSTPREEFLVDKNGKTRVVYTLPSIETLYCSLYTEYLSETSNHLVHPSVVSYRKNTSVGMVCRSLSKSIDGLSFTKIDISKYFDSVSMESVKRLLGRLNLPVHFISLYTRNQVLTVNGVEDRHLGLIQGNPLASFLANTLLYDFDVYMSKNHEVYYRYSDDMLFSQSSTEELTEIANRLAEYNLQINDSKTKYYKGSVEFLGLMVEQDRVSASEKYMVDFRHKIKLTSFEKQGRSPEKYLRRIVDNLAGPWLNSTFYGCRLEYLFGAVTSSHQFFELDNLVYTNIQYLLTGSRNSSVACKRGLTLKNLIDRYDLSFERAFGLYKKSEILSRAYLTSFARDSVLMRKSVLLSDILSAKDLEFCQLTETVRYELEGQKAKVTSWFDVYDQSGLLCDYDVIEDFIVNLSAVRPIKTSVSLGKMSRLKRHDRFILDYSYRMFLVSVAINSTIEIDGFKILYDQHNNVIAATYINKNSGGLI